MRRVPQSEVPQSPFLWSRGTAASETLRYLDRNGIDAEPLLFKAELSRGQLSPDSGGISVASQHRFLEFAATETNDSLLGLHVAAEMDLRDAGILFYLAAASTTVLEALEHLATRQIEAPSGLCSTSAIYSFLNLGYRDQQTKAKATPVPILIPK
jgi:Arabinose-binding domain of AraC transcription regulator, N-term